MRILTTLPQDDLGRVPVAAREAETAGYDGIVTSENRHDPFLALAVASVASTRLSLQTGIAISFSRSPMAVANTSWDLQSASRGRFVLGLGSSSHAIIGDWNGIDFEAPLGHVRESVAILRQALAGEKTDFRGRHFRSKGFKLGSAPRKPMRIYLAALREQMLRLAGAIGEGLIINFQPASAMPQILAAYRAGATAAGRDASRDEVVCRFQVCLTDDRARARGLVRLGFGAYLAAPVYNAYLDWCGFPDEARAIREAFAKRDRQAVAAAIPDALVDRIAILGSEDECRAQLAEFVKAGVTTPVLAPLATSPAEAERIYATFAPTRRG